METYRSLLEERVRLARADAIGSPTAEHLAAYGRVIMARWAANRAPTVEFEAAMQRSVLRLIEHYDDAERRRRAWRRDAIDASRRSAVPR